MSTPSFLNQAFLASNLDQTGGALLDLLKDSPYPAANVLVIPTATFYENRPLKQDVFDLYRQKGIAAGDVCDLRDLADDTDWTARFTQYDILHFCGGNTFGLLFEMNRTGLTDALQRQGFHEPAYPKTIVGESAGALVFCTDIDHISPLDDPFVAPDLKDTAGLNWLPGLLVPHYKSPEWGFGERIDAMLHTMEPATKERLFLLEDTEFVHLMGADVCTYRV